MNYESIISHMNEHHRSNLMDLCKKFGGVENVKEALLRGVDFNDLDIVYDGSENLRIESPKKADEGAIRDTTIASCMDTRSTGDTNGVEKEVEEFKLSFNLVSLAALNKNSKVVCSYAPFVSTQQGNFICISEVGEHSKNIKTNPDNVETMSLEDESRAASVILRKGLRYRIGVSFIGHGEKFDRICDEFERQTGGEGGIRTIRKMLDFHLVKFELGEGCFVKGFGAAYDIENDIIKQVGTKFSPHKLPHKH